MVCFLYQVSPSEQASHMPITLHRVNSVPETKQAGANLIILSWYKRVVSGSNTATRNCLISNIDILWSIHLTNPLILLHVFKIFLTITTAWEKTPVSPFLITRMFLYPSSVSLPNVYGNMPTVWILALVYLFFSLSTCPLQVLLELLGWALCVDSWFPCHLMSTSSFSNTNLLPKLPRSVSHGSNLKDSQLSV